LTSGIAGNFLEGFMLSFGEEHLIGGVGETDGVADATASGVGVGVAAAAVSAQVVEGIKHKPIPIITA
jgi:hypothetical protein